MKEILFGTTRQIIILGYYPIRNENEQLFIWMTVTGREGYNAIPIIELLPEQSEHTGSYSIVRYDRKTYSCPNTFDVFDINIPGFEIIGEFKK